MRCREWGNLEQTIENILEAAKKNLERVDMMVQVSKKLQRSKGECCYGFVLL